MLKPCVVGCAQSFLIIYNCLFLIMGITMIICGIWLHIDRDMMTYLRILEVTPTGNLLSNVSHALIGLGMSLSLLAFFGCFGACCENVCMLLSYISFLFLILTAETIGCVLVGVFKREVTVSIESSMFRQVKEQYNRTTNTTHDITLTWDMMQVKLHCCGAKGPQDYTVSYWYNNSKETGTFVPATCCVLSNDDPVHPEMQFENQCQIDAILFPRDMQTSDAVRTKGCHTALMEWLTDNGLLLILLTGGMGLLQVLGFLFACCLFARIRAEQTRYPWYDMVSE